MTETIKESERMKLICEFIKTGKQPDGFKITETKTGKYRLSRVKQTKEALQAKRKRLEKDIEDIDAELKKYEQPQESETTEVKQEEQA